MLWLPRDGHASSGQWVYTTLFGWIWAPRGEAFVHYPRQGEPHTFVYQDGVGWEWIVAPWVWGNDWPYAHRPWQGPAGRWKGASLDHWRHARKWKVRHGGFRDDDMAFGGGDGFSGSDFAGADWGNGFGNLDFNMGGGGSDVAYPQNP